MSMLMLSPVCYGKKFELVKEGRLWQGIKEANNMMEANRQLNMTEF